MSEPRDPQAGLPPDVAVQDDDSDAPPPDSDGHDLAEDTE